MTYMLYPKKRKYRKAFKGRVKNIQSRPIKISFGSSGLIAKEAGRLSARQIEAARRAIRRRIRPFGKLYIRIFPDIPVSAKSVGARMGRGKGEFSYWMARVVPNQTIFEIGGVSPEQAIEAFKAGSAKLPIATQSIIKTNSISSSTSSTSST